MCSLFIYMKEPFVHANVLLVSIWMFPTIGGKPPKWMVYNEKPYFLMDDLGGTTLFSETPILRCPRKLVNG